MPNLTGPTGGGTDNTKEILNPASFQYQQELAQEQLAAWQKAQQQAQKKPPATPTTPAPTNSNGIPANYVWDGTNWVSPQQYAQEQASKNQQSLNLGGVGGSSGAMTQYEAAQVALDKQKIADAEAQQKADEAYRQAQALDTFNKNWQDFQTKHFYGSVNGPAYASPAGAPSFFKMPEPDYVANYYKNTPNAGPDPWNQPSPYSGYSGTLFSNPQQPGTQVTPPAGSTPAPAIGGDGQIVNGPTPGVTSGTLPGFNPNAPQSGQNVPTPPPIAPSAGAGAGALPPRSMAYGGGSTGTELAILHGGEQVVEPDRIGSTGVPVAEKKAIPQLTSSQYYPGPVPGMAAGGTVPGPPGQPQLAVLHGKESVVPGGNFSAHNPSPVANAGPESMNPLIQQLLSAVNGIITSPEFQSAVYSSNGMAKPPVAGGDDSSPLMGGASGGDDSMPGSFATGWPPLPGTYDSSIYRPGSVPGTWMDVATGRPVSAAQASPGTPAPAPVPNPIGNPKYAVGAAGMGGGSGAGITGIGSIGGFTPPPISASAAAQQSGVIAGPTAINHVPYGPELTGMSGFGGLITPNGTPVAASEWQRQHLDPTSLGNYEDYAGSIAGWNPADLKQQSDQMTGVLNENSPTIKAPTKFDLSGAIPVPGQGGG